MFLRPSSRRHGSSFDSELEAPIIPPPKLNRPQPPPPCPHFTPFSDTNINNNAEGSSSPSRQHRTLVIYLWANNDAHYLENLEYFVRTAMRCNQPTDYIVVLNQVEPGVPPPKERVVEGRAPYEAPDFTPGSEWDPTTQPWPGHVYVNPRYLPQLPPNAVYVQHPNECFDLGTAGWVMQCMDWINQGEQAITSTATKRARTAPPHLTDEIRQQLKRFRMSDYDYFVILNGSLRGPFYPSWVDTETVDVHGRATHLWYWPYVKKMIDDTEVKLVGATISCAIEIHVQSMIVVTDRGQTKQSTSTLANQGTRR